MLDTKVKVFHEIISCFHEMTLKLYFMKCLERKISQCILPFRNIERQIAIHIPPNVQRISVQISKRRYSRPDVFCKEGVLINFTKFTGKHLCQNLFLNKVVGPQPAQVAQVLSCEFCEISKNTFFIEHLWWLLL